jgi:hypothetical protein
MSGHFKFQRINRFVLQQTAIIPKQLISLVRMRDCKATNKFCLVDLVDIETTSDGTLMVYECEWGVGDLSAELSAPLAVVRDFVGRLFADGIRILPTDV